MNDKNTKGNLPGPSWKGLYKIGGVSAVLYMALALIIPTIMVVIKHYDFDLSGPDLLPFIASHKGWWMVIQSLLLEMSISMIIAFAALFAALKNINKSAAVVAALIGVVSQILFMAYYPVILGLTHLSNQFAAASVPQQQILSTAAEALIAQNNAFNPVYEALLAISVLIFSLVMMKSVFGRLLGIIGIVSCAACIIGLCLWPVIGRIYFFWWAFVAVWFVAAGIKLIKLGKAA